MIRRDMTVKAAPLPSIQRGRTGVLRRVPSTPQIMVPIDMRRIMRVNLRGNVSGRILDLPAEVST